ncbi:MAG: hypothetical protein WB502_08160, partial [Thermoactinomyces sp.]
EKGGRGLIRRVSMNHTTDRSRSPALHFTIRLADAKEKPPWGKASGQDFGHTAANGTTCRGNEQDRRFAAAPRVLQPGGCPVASLGGKQPHLLRRLRLGARSLSRSAALPKRRPSAAHVGAMGPGGRETFVSRHRARACRHDDFVCRHDPMKGPRRKTFCGGARPDGTAPSAPPGGRRTSAVENRCRRRPGKAPGWDRFLSY